MIDPCTRTILDFIYRYESGGNYNAYFGHGSNTSVHLTEMTIEQVQAFQDRMVAGGSRSSAVGAPQFIRVTMASLNPDPKDIFTPDLQDALAIRLLVRRGYEKWWEGDLPDETFALNLSKEWASMPNPLTGTSYYPGQKTKYTVADVYVMLAKARSLIKPLELPSVQIMIAALDAFAATLATFRADLKKFDQS